jgi:hypothetical protein
MVAPSSILSTCLPLLLDRLSLALEPFQRVRLLRRGRQEQMRMRTMLSAR